jgi:hypothetical protein
LFDQLKNGVGVMSMKVGNEFTQLLRKTGVERVILSCCCTIKSDFNFFPAGRDLHPRTIMHKELGSKGSRSKTEHFLRKKIAISTILSEYLFDKKRTRRCLGLSL